MIDCKQIFICHKCGEVDGETHEMIDCERDKVEYHVVCTQCGGSVIPKTENGVNCYRKMSQEEIWAEMGFYDDSDY